MDRILYKAPQLFEQGMTDSLDSTEYQNILEIVTCVIIPPGVYMLQKNAP